MTAILLISSVRASSTYFQLFDSITLIIDDKHMLKCIANVSGASACQRGCVNDAF